LIDPVSALSGEKPELKETEHWYMPLGDTQEKLEKWLDTRKNWKPNVMGQVKSWLNDGLADRAATRDLSWGVPVPLENAKGKVLYVWFDAPIGYISATKEWAEEKGTPEAWKDYWQDENSELYHFIGKDNIVFHCIMFPTILMEHGGYVMPENVPANEFLNLEGKKLSTSRGWAVWLHEYLEDFSPDLLRYALGVTLPESKDSDFSWKDFQARVNNELVAVLGNFVNRTLTFTKKFAEGKVPDIKNVNFDELDILNSILKQKDKIEENYDNFRFRDAIHESLHLARLGNQYFTKNEPWKTFKTNKEECYSTIYCSLQICGALSIIFEPILPDSMKKLRKQLGINDQFTWNDILWDNIGNKDKSIVQIGTEIEVGQVLFTKIEDEEIEAQIARLEERAAANDPTSKFTPLKENIGFEDFMKLDIRAGEILEAEKIEKSDKLLKLKVDIGIEIRTIVSGIAKHVDMDKIIGQKVSVVANLAPKKLMGVESAGMILMAEDTEGNLKFVDTEAESGSTIT
jgi:methionyl-tRNA synthetase